MMLRVTRTAPKGRAGAGCMKASAYDGNRLVGAVVACDSLKNSRDIWQVDKINVIEDYQRRGVGTLLYREMADVACEKGVPLASSPRTWRSRASTGFWGKQLAKGRAKDIGDGVIVLDQSCGADLSSFDLVGGKSEGMRPSSFNPSALKRGTKVELEHTRSRKIAQRIAMDHLVEDPKYYEKLAKIHLDGFQLPQGKQLWFALGGLGVLALLLSSSSTTSYSSTGTGFVNPITGKKLVTTGKLAFMFDRGEGHMHRGVDIPANKGTPALAAANGVVRVATDVYKPGFSGYGRVVVLENNGVWTLYGHLDSVRVSVGQKVGAGQEIGTVGTSQFFSYDQTREDKMGAHLHFEVSPTRYPQASEASRIDPVAWLRSGGAAVA